MYACAYSRPGVGCGGWGFHAANVARAAVDYYHGVPQATASSILTFTQPQNGQSVAASHSVDFVWTATVGEMPAAVNVMLDGKVVASGVKGNKFTLLVESLAVSCVCVCVCQGQAARLLTVCAALWNRWDHMCCRWWLQAVAVER